MCIRDSLYVAQDGVSVPGEAEEVILLLHPLHGPPAVRARAFRELAREQEGLVLDAVPPLVSAEIDVAALLQLLDEELGHLRVAVLGRADKVIVADVEKLPGIREVRDHTVNPRLRTLVPPVSYTHLTLPTIYT